MGRFINIRYYYYYSGKGSRTSAINAIGSAGRNCTSRVGEWVMTGVGEGVEVLRMGKDFGREPLMPLIEQKEIYFTCRCVDVLRVEVR